MPADRSDAGRVSDDSHAASYHGAFLRLVEMSLIFPAPAMAHDFVSVFDSVASEPRRRLQRPTAKIERELDAEFLEHAHDPPIARAAAIFEMAFHAEIARAFKLLVHLVDALVALVAGRQRKLRAFLDVEHERNRDACPFWPAHDGRMFAITEKIPIRVNTCHLPTHRVNPTSRPCARATISR